MFSMCCVLELFWTVVYAVLPVVSGIWLLRQILRRSRPQLNPPAKHVAFFHPYCNDGGGGERVLWTAVCALANRYPSHVLSVYTGDREPDAAIAAKVRQRFGLTLPAGLRLVRVRSRRLLEPANYPLLTLLGQALGSVVVALEALCRLLPDLYIDSMGYGFTLPVFRLLGGCRVGCYVHYPTISSDMLQSVSLGETAFNNRAEFSRVPALRCVKLGYYRLFAALYGAVGRAAHSVMVNSSWTRAHIVEIWGREERVRTVYPPCDLERILQVPITTERRRCVLSVAQFRPEKNHQLQLESFSRLLTEHPSESAGLQLLLVGGCRDARDEARVSELRRRADQLGIADRVQFLVNVSYDELLKLYAEALIGLHTMKNEHFGIGIVEMMAAGLLVVAHCSGGPLTDIVDTGADTRTGYLASSSAQYAGCMLEVLTADQRHLADVRERARKSCKRFSEKNFEHDFLKACQELL